MSNMRTTIAVVCLALSGCAYDGPLFSLPAQPTPVTHRTALEVLVSPNSITAPGTAAVVARVDIDGAPAPDGTRVVFGTSAGFVEPAEARTVAGTASISYRTSSSSGVVRITATAESTSAGCDLMVVQVVEHSQPEPPDRDEPWPDPAPTLPSGLQASVNCTATDLSVFCNVEAAYNDRPVPSNAISVTWDWGNTVTAATGPVNNHSYTQKGTYRIVATVAASTSAGQKIVTASTRVTVPPPTVP
jgi:hypothetical protein